MRCIVAGEIVYAQRSVLLKILLNALPNKFIEKHLPVLFFFIHCTAYMRLTDLNRDRDIGSSAYLLELGSFRILIDAGLHPKHAGTLAMPKFDLIEDFSLDYIFITHSHLDHIGSLPVIARKQPQAPIICTGPTQLLTPRMLHNSHRVMLYQRDELSIPEYPLYSKTDIDTMARNMHPIAYYCKRTLSKLDDHVDITFFPAGHIPGAAGILIEYKHNRIFISGDVLFDNQHTLDGAHFPINQVDTLILETTRGKYQRPENTSRYTEEERLVESIIRTLEHGGSCVMPVFALGRMQEMMAVLHKARAQGRLSKDFPIFCSGLGVDLADYYDQITKKHTQVHFRKKIYQELGARPFYPKFVEGETPPGPAIYLLSSGMMIEKTPSNIVAASLLNGPHNSIFFVGYCDPETPGGKLLQAKRGEAFLFEDLKYSAIIRAEIDYFDLSAHADRDQLLQFAYSVNPRTVILVHGDLQAREWFEESLYGMSFKGKIVDPIPGEGISL